MERDDTISRNAAIDAFDCSVGGVPVESVKYVSEYADKMMSRINALPSAQPTQCNSSNILQHPQCANRTKLGNCDPVGGFCTSVSKEMCDVQEHDTLNGSDLISRAAAIDAIEILLEQSEDDEHNKTWNNAIRGAINSIKYHVPSAQSESDKEKISELLMRLYLMGLVHLTKDSIVRRRRQHYCEELWKALFHDDKLPVWMHWYDIEREKSQ